MDQVVQSICKEPREGAEEVVVSIGPRWIGNMAQMA
jgi:hypothetical protein